MTYTYYVYFLLKTLTLIYFMNDTGSNGTSAVAIIITIVIIVGAVFYFKSNPGNHQPAPTNSNQPTTTEPIVTNRPTTTTQAAVTTTNHLPGGLAHQQSQATCNPNSPATITVTSPSAGAVLVNGQQTTITWTSCNIQNVYISMAIGGHDMGAFSESAIPANPGSYTVTINSPQVNQQNIHGPYRIMVEGADANDRTVNGISGDFTIN